jgi:hypothetical protein
VPFLTQWTTNDVIHGYGEAFVPELGS